MAAELTLTELCKAFDVSQEELAKILGVKQANVSKIERREDMRLSTLVTYMRAMGGDIEIVAHFPNRSGGKDKTIKLKPFVEDTVHAAQSERSFPLCYSGPWVRAAIGEPIKGKMDTDWMLNFVVS